MIAIYGKSMEDGFLPYLRQLVESLQNRGMELICEDKFALLLQEKYTWSPGFKSTFSKAGLKREDVSMLLSIGGDGTFLDTVVYVRENGIPVLGVNSGHLGFLANVKADEVEQAAECIATGHYSIEQREMLQLQIDDKEVKEFNYALNDIGVLKVATSSLLKIHAYIGDVYLTTYWADGLVVATPTGSTAYSLSGGGPIVSPECKNIILTPICPHNLSMRPLVVPNDAEIKIQVESRSGDFVLSVDSRLCKMKDRHCLSIRTGKSRMNVVNLSGHNYYDTLRNKLKWGEDKRNDGRRFE